MVANDKAIKACLKVAYAGYMDNDNSTNDSHDPRRIEDDSVRTHYTNGSTQQAFYEERRLERKENPYYAGFINYVTNRLATGIYFTGAGAEACTDFFTKTCPDAFMQLRLAIQSAVGNGPGFQYLYYDAKKKLKQIITADHSSFQLQYTATGPNSNDDQFEQLKRPIGTSGVDAKWIEIIDEGSDRKFYMKNYNRMTLKDYQVVDNRIGFLRLIYDEREAHGEPVGEASYFDIKSMKRLNRNIMAGLERNLSQTVKIGLDLDAYNDDEKATKITEANDNFKGTNWNTLDSIACDQRLKIGTMGLYQDDGQSNNERMLEPGKIIEPVLSSILFSYYVAIGLIEQTGANKSLIVAQQKSANLGIAMLRSSVDVYLSTQIIPLITKDEVNVRYRPDLDSDDVSTLFASGVISRDYAQEALGIIDIGTNFVETTQPVAGSSDGDNHDDNPTKKRAGPQSKGVAK